MAESLEQLLEHMLEINWLLEIDALKGPLLLMKELQIIQMLQVRVPQELDDLRLEQEMEDLAPDNLNLFQ